MADITIKDVRAKYPQYSDMSDTQLADALHSKFYSDMPKDEFYSKIGLKSSAPAAAPTQPSTYEKLKSQVLGTARLGLEMLGEPVTGAADLAYDVIRRTGPDYELHKLWMEKHPGEAPEKSPYYVQPASSTALFEKGLGELGLPEYTPQQRKEAELYKLAPIGYMGGKMALSGAKAAIGRLGEIPRKVKVEQALGELRGGVKGETERMAQEQADKAAQSRAGMSQAQAMREETKRATEAAIPPHSMEELGTDIQARAKAHFQLTSERTQEEIASYQEELKKLPSPKDKGFTSSVNAINNFIQNDVSPGNTRLISSLKSALNSIKQAKTFNSADSEVKGLRALSKSEEGSMYGEEIKKLADNIQSSMMNSSPVYRGLIEKYPELKGQVESISEKFSKLPASEIPKEAFRNATSYRDFVNAVGGDEKYAKEVAGKYFTEQIRGMSSKQIRDFTDKNSDVLNAIGGDTEKAMHGYADTVSKLEEADSELADAQKEFQDVAKKAAGRSVNLRLASEQLGRSRGVEDVKKTIDDLARNQDIDKETADNLYKKFQDYQDVSEKYERLKKGVRTAALGVISSFGGYWFWKTYTVTAGHHQ